MHDRVVLADVPGGEHPGDRALKARGAAHAAALADLETRPLRQLHVGRHAGADHHRVGRELEAAPGDHLGDPPVALEALELIAAMDGHAVRFQQPWKKRPTVAPKPRSSVLCSCITIVQRLPISVSDAATSQPM